MSNLSRSEKSAGKGRVAFVGTGLKAIGHMTLETVSEIQSADAVYYHAADGVTAAHIQALNKNTHDLYQFYGNDKPRNETYLQMAEIVLSDIRKGMSVCAVYYGHPGVFVKPIRRIQYWAQKEGHETVIYPGITTMDYLFGELRVDPSKNGCQILEATDFYLKKRQLDTTSSVIILQIGAFGDATFSFQGYPKRKFNLLAEELIAQYTPDAPCSVFRGSSFPGAASVVHELKLSDLLSEEVQKKRISGVSTLYIPPLELKASDAERVSVLGLGKAGATTPMGLTAWETTTTPRMQAVIDSIDRHAKPDGFVRRKASRAMYQVMKKLATNASALADYQRDPARYAARQNKLTLAEKRALRSGSVTRIGAVTRQQSVSDDTNNFLNGLINTNSTFDFLSTYVSAAKANQDPEKAATAYIAKLGYTSVSLDDVSNAISAVMNNSSVSVSGTYQTFDSNKNPGPYFEIKFNNGSSVQVLTETSGELIDISGDAFYNPSKKEFLVQSSDAFPYSGNLTFTGINTSSPPSAGDYTGYRLNVALKGSDGSETKTSGKNQVYSADAAASDNETDSYSFWEQSYTTHVIVNGKYTDEQTLEIKSNNNVSYDGKSANFDYDGLGNSLTGTIDGDQFLIILLDQYFKQDKHVTGKQFFGYKWPVGAKRPMVPNFIGDTPPPSPPSPPQPPWYDYVLVITQAGFVILSLLYAIRKQYLVSKAYDGFIEARNAEAQRLADTTFDQNPSQLCASANLAGTLLSAAETCDSDLFDEASEEPGGDNDDSNDDNNDDSNDDNHDDNDDSDDSDDDGGDIDIDVDVDIL